MSSIPSPVGLMRSVLMDLGFAGLIEEIDKRFGSLMTNFMLVVVFVGIVVWVFSLLLSEFHRIEVMLRSGNAWEVLLGLAYRMGITAVLCVAGIGIVHHQARKLNRHLLAKNRELLSHVEQAVKDLDAARKEYEASRAVSARHVQDDTVVKEDT